MAKTLSVTTAPPISSAMPMPMTVTIGIGGVLQRMQEQDAHLRRRPWARGADIILLQHFQHRGAGDARDQRDIDKAERDRGQDQVLEPRPEAPAQIGV